MAHAIGYKTTPEDADLAVPKRVWTALTTAINKGDAFCYNGDLATDERGNTEAISSAGTGRYRVVEAPTLANIADFAGFAAQAYSANAAGQWITINVPRVGQTLPVRAKADCTAVDTVLGPIPTQDHVREGCLYPEAGFALLAVQTVDRSTTAGLVQCRVIPHDSPLVKASTFEFCDDFEFSYDDTATTGTWTEVEDADKTTLEDAAGGVVKLAPDTTDNNESYAHSVAKIFKVAAGKPIRFKARIKASEAGTDGDENNIIIGLSDTVAANFLQNDGAGPPDSYDGIVIFKVDGESVFQLETSNDTTQENDTDIGTLVKDTWHEVEFLVDPADGTTAEVNAWVDKVLGTASAVDLVISGLEEMHVAFGVKVGNDDINAETLEVDYVLARAVR